MLRMLRMLSIKMRWDGGNGRSWVGRGKGGRKEEAEFRSWENSGSDGTIPDMAIKRWVVAPSASKTFSCFLFSFPIFCFVSVEIFFPPVGTGMPLECHWNGTGMALEWHWGRCDRAQLKMSSGAVRAQPQWNAGRVIRAAFNATVAPSIVSVQFQCSSSAISEQFQSNSRAISEQFQSNFPAISQHSSAVPVQFQCSSSAVPVQFQCNFGAISEQFRSNSPTDSNTSSAIFEPFPSSFRAVSEQWPSTNKTKQTKSRSNNKNNQINQHIIETRTKRERERERLGDGKPAATLRGGQIISIPRRVAKPTRHKRNRNKRTENIPRLFYLDI